MARQTNRLSHIAIKALSKPGLHADGNGLYLSVGKTGSKSWVLVYVSRKRRVELGLGRFPAVSLSEARELAQEAARLRAKGIDPKAEWRRPAEPDAATFGEVALRLIEDRSGDWRNAKHRAQWRSTLETYGASIWNMPVANVTVDDILELLRPIWTTKAETASRVRGRVAAVLDAAKARGLRDGHNPAAWQGNLSVLLSKPKKGVRGHHRAMAYEEVPAFYVKLREAKGLAARALELLVHTAARTSEVLGARWDEFDCEAKVWTVPAERMKAGKVHRVPLTEQAVALFQELPRGSEFLFPGKGEKPLSNMAMTMVLQRMGQRDRCTVHGFRSTFRDWVHEATEVPREIAEQALAHQVGTDVERAYRRSDALERRRRLMADWSDHLATA